MSARGGRALKEHRGHGFAWVGQISVVALNDMFDQLLAHLDACRRRLYLANAAGHSGSCGGQVRGIGELSGRPMPTA